MVPRRAVDGGRWVVGGGWWTSSTPASVGYSSLVCSSLLGRVVADPWPVSAEGQRERAGLFINLPSGA